MNFNFSNFKLVTKTYTKEGGIGPREALVFDMRYRRAVSKNAIKGVTGVEHEESFFEVGKAKFDALGLNGTDKGVIQIVYSDGVSYLAIVDNDNATLLKTSKKNEKGEKGRKFKSPIIETALSEQGLIDTKILGESQWLALNLVAGSEGQTLGEGEGAVKTYGIYEVVKADKPANATSETEAETESAPVTQPESEASVAPEAPVSEALTAEPVAEPAAPTAAATPASDDDF